MPQFLQLPTANVVPIFVRTVGQTSLSFETQDVSLYRFHCIHIWFDGTVFIKI